MINITEVGNMAVRAEISALKQQISALAAEKSLVLDDAGVAKNHKHCTPTNAMYKRISDEMLQFGKIPQQQKDLATILIGGMKLMVEYKEAEVFAILMSQVDKYPSLSTSTQHPTYLLRYYRGLGNKGKYAGFIARDFLRVR